MLLLPFIFYAFATNAKYVKFDEHGRRFGYIDVPIGHNTFQQIFDYGLKKTAGIKNKFANGKDKHGKIKYSNHFPIGQWRKSIITLYGAAGLSTSQIQTYSTHTSAKMVDHYVQHKKIQNQREENDLRIRDFIFGSKDHRKSMEDYQQSTQSMEQEEFGFNEAINDELSCVSSTPSLSAYSSMSNLYTLYTLYLLVLR